MVSIDEVDFIKMMQILADLYGEQEGITLKVTGRKKTPEELDEYYRKKAQEAGVIVK